MKRLKRLLFLLKVHKSIPFIIEFFISKEVSTKKKLVFLSLPILYWLFPIDIVPDFFVGFGQIDEVFVISLVLNQMLKSAPQYLKEKYQFKVQNKKVIIQQ